MTAKPYEGRGKYLGIWVAIGIGLGFALRNPGLGLAIGVAVGLLMDYRKQRELNKDQTANSDDE